MSVIENGGIMKKVLRFRVVALLLTVTAFSLAFPGAANSAPGNSGNISSSYSNSCATGWVAPASDEMPIRSQARNNATVLERVKLGYIIRCSKHVAVTGDHYNGCGIYDASAWLIVLTDDGVLGYTAMTCWRDFH
ncbi:hypothetical protein [Streptomyces sp. NBC_00005]|uniref:hypothetical protein n=1 Tax=Streptomyces sp. NBC_00005 TaxID=2903609 RepID=UPI00325065F2